MRSRSWGQVVLTVVALVVSTFGLVLLAKTGVTYAQVDEIGRLRQPVSVAGSPGSGFLGAWSSLVIGDETVGVWYLESGGVGAPLPPGVASWPGPGQAVVSSAVAEMVEAPAYLGEIVGVLPSEVLAMAGERIAYVVPAVGAAIRGEMTPYSGFGAQRSSPFGIARSQALLPQWLVWLFVGLLLVFPGFALLFSVRRMEPNRRWDEEQLLRVWGLSGWGITRWNLQRNWVGLVGGGLCCVGVVAYLVCCDVPIPGTTLTLSKAMTFAQVMALIVVMVGAFMVASGVLVTPLARAPRAHKKPRSARVGAMVCLGGIAVMSGGSIGVAELGMSLPPDVAYLLGLLVTLFTSTALVRWVVGKISAGVFVKSLVGSDPVRTIALRGQGKYVMAGLAGRVGALIVVLSFAAMWTSVLVGSSQRAVEGSRAEGGRFALMRPILDEHAGQRFEQLFARLDPTVGVIAVQTDAPPKSGSILDGKNVLLASGSALNHFKLQPGVTTGAGLPFDLRYLVSLPGEQVRVVVGDPRQCLALGCEGVSKPSVLFFYAEDGSRLDVAGLNSVVRTVAVPGWELATQGAVDIASQEAARNLGGIIVVCAFGGVLLLVGASWVSVLSGFRRTLAGLWPALLVVSGEGLLRRCALWMVGFPLLVGTGIALALNMLLWWVMSVLVVNEVPNMLGFNLVAGLLVCVGGALTVWGVGRDITAKSVGCVLRGGM